VGAIVTLDLARGSSSETIEWTAGERRAIRRLSLESLPSVPRDPGNRVADDPRAAELGHRLFFDARLSANGRVSCASCHMPQRGFQDGLRVGKGIGRTDRRTMPLAGVAYARWLFWDGRRDSLWAQALTPLESSVEHGITRTVAVRHIASHHRRTYEAVFGPLRGARVDEVFANLGKAIAAYERLLRPAPSRFDRFASSLGRGGREAILSPEEERGLRLFVGEGQCASCHSGPLFTNGEFHNTGVPQTTRDAGRAEGALLALRDPFNCLGRFSDAEPPDCTALRFIVTDRTRLLGAFKVPSLRDVAARAPYMHAGQLATLRDVLEHYRRAPDAAVGHSELAPLDLTDRQLDEIVLFLGALDGGVAAPERLLRPPRR
jgi:cytochrome c peroxidase